MSSSTNLDFEEKLLQLVQERPYLYQKRRPDYKDALKKKNSWEVIATETTTTADLCKETWESLRKQYTTYLRKIDNPTGSESQPLPYFRHSKSMEFYKDVYRPHKNKTVSNFQSAEPNEIDPNNNEDSEGEEVHDIADIQEFVEVNQTKNAAACGSKRISYTVDAKENRQKNKRKSSDDFEKQFLGLYEQSLNSQNEFYHFGHLVAQKLRNLNSQGKDTFDIQIRMLELINKPDNF